MSPLAADLNYISIYEISRKFHLSPETVRLWIVRGLLKDGERIKLAATKIGGQWRVTETALISWIDMQSSLN